MLSCDADELHCFGAHQLISNWKSKAAQSTKINGRSGEIETGSNADCLVELAVRIFVKD